MATWSFVLSALMAIAPSPSLTVMVQDTGVVRSVPPGAQRVSMLSLSFEASCDADIMVRGITLRHRGQGASADIAAVYALSGGRRVTAGRSIASRDGRVHLPLRDVVIPACGSMQFVIAADYAADAAVAGEHRFVVASASDIDAPDAMVSLVQSTAGQPMVSTGVPVGSVDIAYLPLHRRPLYGTDRTLARIQLTADGRSDLQILSVTLTNDGSARDDDLQRLSVQSTGAKTLTDTVASMDGDIVHLMFVPPLQMNKNSTKLLELHGDVRASRRRTIDFVVKESSDITVQTASRTRR